MQVRNYGFLFIKFSKFCSKKINQTHDSVFVINTTLLSHISNMHWDITDVVVLSDSWYRHRKRLIGTYNCTIFLIEFAAVFAFYLNQGIYWFWWTKKSIITILDKLSQQELDTKLVCILLSIKLTGTAITKSATRW